MDWMKEAQNRQDELILDLQQLIQIPSVLDESLANVDYPFGPEPYRALKWLLDKGEKEGMIVKDVDHMAGHIEMGEGEEILGILGHVDVVPAGNGWTYPPFEGTVVGNKLFGRGSIDDKGPTMAAWMAMKMVKDAGIQLDKRVRLIIGTDEESGFRCVERYFQKEAMPTIGFAPDADFPIINAEKGISTLRFSFQTDNTNEDIQSFASGKRTNMVPDFAEAVFIHDDPNIGKTFEQFLLTNKVKGSVIPKHNEWHFTLEGKSAHAMEPDDGVNAAIYLAKFLAEYVTSTGSKKFIDFLVNTFWNDSRGHAIGLAFTDEMSGDTTLNAGVIAFDGKTGTVDVSLRYSVSYTFEEKLTQCQTAVNEQGIAVDVLSNSKPHYVDESEELIQSLKKVYERQTGEPATLLAIGGGTYARVLEKGVAFGMLFPGEKDVAHQLDEFVDIQNLIKSAAIYADAICELAGKKRSLDSRKNV
ncbi:MAG: dipeptidase PepV [Planococcaceae bacterium]|nr:dipeptidase PepV [Planococcaceae bacterium]